METHAQFVAEVMGYVVIGLVVLAVGVVGHMVADLRNYRNGTHRTPAQRHTRSHHTR
jgi:hypothetical protein